MSLTDPYADPATFWSDPPAGVIGPWNPEQPDGSPDHVRQEADLLGVLEDNALFFSSVFEAGCGFGRLARFFALWYPEAEYHAIDVGIAQLKSAQRFHPRRSTFERADLLTYTSPHTYDLVVTSEVLMHVRPADLPAAFAKLVDLMAPVGRLVIVEWVPLPGKVPAKIAFWNFPHDYDALFREAGAHTIARQRTGQQVIYLLAP